MDTSSAYHNTSFDTTDDTERQFIDTETLIYHTDQTPSSYDILSQALSDDSTGISHTQYSLATLWDASTSRSTMPGAHGGLKPWPDTSHLSRDDNNPSQNAIRDQQPREQASTATLRSHYDPSLQASSISQQTSASSIRDMALRKGTQAVLRKEDKRPLKSALKRYPSQHREPVAHPQFLYPLEHEQPPAVTQKAQSRLSRLGNFLLRRTPSNKSSHSSQVSRTPSTVSAASSHYPTPTGPRRKRSIGWDKPLHQYDSARAASAQSDVSDIVRQAKLAEDDVYEKAKMNRRRPPKGIQNWFEGVEVSDEDEDEELTPVELPAHEPLPSTFSTFSTKRTPVSQDARRARRTELEQKQRLSKAERILGQRTGVSQADAIDKQSLPNDTRQYLEDEYLDHRAATPKASAQARRNESALSMVSSIDGTDTDLTDRTGRSSATDHYSVQSDIAYHHAHAMNMQRPQIPPRRLQNAQIAHHNAYNVNEQSKLLLNSTDSRFSNRSERTDELYGQYDDRPTTTSSHRSSTRTTSERPKSRGRGSPRVLPSNGYDDGNGDMDMSPDISHMMAVTEEEMALLEMMRNKRAAMQKNSYSEGYRQALQKEHEQMMQRRMLAQQTALRILRSQEQQEQIRQRQTRDHRDLDEKDIRKLNKLRQQELDRTKRLKDFLAMDTSLAAALDDAGVSQHNELVQNWPLQKHQTTRSPDADERRNRRSTATPSFSRRDIYDDSDRSQGRRSRSGTNNSNLAITFPEPPAMPDINMSRYKQSPSRSEASNLVRFESTTSSGTKSHRKSQALYTKQTVEEAAVRQELYMLREQSAVRTSKIPQPSRQQLQSTTFLRSNSDFQAAENNSVTSQGSASISATSPRTPSSTGHTRPSKLTSYAGLDSEDGELTSHSLGSNYAKHNKDASGRRKKQLPSALSILAESDRVGYRGSLANGHTAGDDVLAAWAELGGNEGMLTSRRTR